MNNVLDERQTGGVSDSLSWPVQRFGQFNVEEIANVEISERYIKVNYRHIMTVYMK